MNQDFYTLPLNTANLITNKEVDKCSLKQSIAHHIHLINTSYFGECSFDETYGCSIWDVDFDNLSSSTKIKEVIRKSLLIALEKHEKRLSRVRVEVNIKQEEQENPSSIKKNILIKKKVTLKVKGKVEKTNEEFIYNEYFFIGPLSY